MSESRRRVGKTSLSSLTTVSFRYGGLGSRSPGLGGRCRTWTSLVHRCSVSPHLTPDRLRTRLLDLFSLRLMLVVAVIVALEQALGSSFKDKAANNAYAFVILSLVAAVLALYALSENSLSPLLKWLFVLVLSLSEAVFLATIDAIHDTNGGFLTVVFALCTVVSMALAGRVKHSTPEQLLDWPATFGLAFTATAVVMVSLYACNELGSLASQGFSILLVIQLLLAAWFAFHAAKIYATMEPSELVEAMANTYILTLQAYMEAQKEADELKEKLEKLGKQDAE